MNLVTPFYIRRPVENADEIVAWCRAERVPDPFPPEKLHVTVVYSRAPVGRQALALHEDRLVLPEAPRAMAIFEWGTLVLRLDDERLAVRHAEFLAAGASHDYRPYSPHITVAHPGTMRDLPDGFPGRITLGPEEFREIAPQFRPSGVPFR